MESFLAESPGDLSATLNCIWYVMLFALGWWLADQIKKIIRGE